MALFNKKGLFSYQIIREGEEVILRIDCEDYPTIPSLEDDPKIMAKTIEILLEVRTVTKIIFYQKRNFEYDYGQTTLLLEITKLYRDLTENKEIFSYNSLISDPNCTKCVNMWYSEIRHILSDLLKSDPLSAYVELTRLLRREKVKKLKEMDARCEKCENNLIKILTNLTNRLGKTKIVSMTKDHLAGHKIGDRSIYQRIFNPVIKPDFMFTKLMASYPLEGEELDNYNVNDTEVSIFQLPDTIQYLYHIIPPEFRLSEDKYEILDSARRIMAEHKPKKSEFVDPDRMRQVFFNIGHDLIEELTDFKKIKLKQKEINQLTEILVRYTVGFGLIEVLLQDEKIQDITINSPMGNIPIFIVHEQYTDCKTNIIPTIPEAESWASKMRMISGRPLDEANPVLDTEISLPNANARVAIISPPLNPSGLAYAFRRHRDKPWTLPLFVKNKMMTPLAAGLISFLVDGSRTMLIAGTRSAGKTSILGSVLTEIMRKYRIITIEDTLELPTSQLRKLGYNIQHMKVAAAMTKGAAEVPADEGIRTTLRMGDSCLIVGEVRSQEARALYEAMRIGAMANVVAGTIHGDSPYGVFDRVVNDLNVPRTSFKATDVVIVANPVRSADGLHRWRRITQITEIRKHWEQDPLLENGFVDLMKYESKNDQLEPSNDLITGESEVLKAIGGNVKEWAGNWDAIWENIQLRAKVKETLVTFAEKTKTPSLLEADFVIHANDEFHRISDKVKEEVGNVDPKKVFFDWNEWLKRTFKKGKIE
jgi:type IV secretory pathway ATPase VirB11/archaellum biosynthesis ATPase